MTDHTTGDRLGDDAVATAGGDFDDVTDAIENNGRPTFGQSRASLSLPWPANRRPWPRSKTHDDHRAGTARSGHPAVLSRSTNDATPGYVQLTAQAAIKSTTRTAATPTNQASRHRYQGHGGGEPWIGGVSGCRRL